MNFIIKNRILFIVCVLFLLLITPTSGQIYHQDEYSWLTQMDGTDNSPQVHPPLYLFLGRAVGGVIGFDHIRWLTVPFALANLILVYAISLKLTQRRDISLTSAGLFAVNAYSVLAATMVDIDGALLPFFVLLAYLSYLNILDGKQKWYWILAFAIIGGFLSKLAFVLFVCTLIVDVVIRLIDRKNISVVQMIQQFWQWLLGGAFFVFVIFVLSKKLLPGVVAYAEHFSVFNFGSRSFADLGFKLLKSAVLTGPLLVLGSFLSLWRVENLRRYRFLWLYLLFPTIFYAVIFDFTTLTIERYFMFIIAPLAIISAEPIFAMLSRIFGDSSQRTMLLRACAITIAVGATLFISHDVLPLYPKAVFAHRALSTRWNFLVPITGGSGPIGFYISALFTGLTWLIMAGSAIFWKKIKNIGRTFAAALFISLGVLMTAVMLQEYLFGEIYGSPNRVAWETVRYINENPKIKKVITYYNIAPYDLRLSGKYEARFFVTPKRDYSGRISAFRGHYMVVEFPAIAKDDRYMQIIGKCPIIKEFQDKQIHSYIYDCTNL